MAKTIYACTACGAIASKWQGKCNACGEWNTLQEEQVEKQSKAHNWKGEKEKEISARKKAQPISQIETTRVERFHCPDPELHRVLGGGIVPGSLILVGGEPGIGKSTLMLQLALQIQQVKTLYISGEESEEQVKLRSTRIADQLPKDLFVFSETQTESIFRNCKELQPQILIIDSIQTLQASTLDSPPGTVSQIRECTGQLQRFAKETNTTVFIIGHITKEGSIAGPKLLEHMVDTVLQFEGDTNYNYRLLRSLKNRFGSTAELGIYEMKREGLSPVANPSAVLLSDVNEPTAGIVIAAALEGGRPLLVEVQALVSTAVFGTPQRSANGIDLKRLHMLLAVIEKRGGLRISACDVFLNITGGISIKDPGLDLAIITALISSYTDTAIPTSLAFAGEVGLSGEIRPVSRFEERMKEVQRMGLNGVVYSAYQKEPCHEGLNAISHNRLDSFYYQFFPE